MYSSIKMTCVWMQVRESMDKLGKQGHYGPGRNLVQGWYGAVVEAIKKEQHSIKVAERGVPDRLIYGPFLNTLDAEHLAVINPNPSSNGRGAPSSGSIETPWVA